MCVLNGETHKESVGSSPERPGETSENAETGKSQTWKKQTGQHTVAYKGIDQTRIQSNPDVITGVLVVVVVEPLLLGEASVCNGLRRRST